MAADLSITATDVAPVLVIEQITLPAAEAIDAGEVVFIDTNGKAQLADQDEATEDDPAGVAITTANAAGITITVLRKGLLDLGNALGDLAYGATVYLSATPGGIYDSDPGNTIVIGKVNPAWGYTTADKVLRLDL